MPTETKLMKRVKQLEEAIFEIHAHNVNIAHHKSRIDMIVKDLFTEKQFRIRSQSGGPNPIYASDLLSMLQSGKKSKKIKTSSQHAKKLAELQRLHEQGK